MNTRRRVFLPKWQRWYVLPILGLVWGMITYLEFWNPENTEKLGTVGYVLFTLLFLSIGGMIWAMTSGILPAYEIEDDER